jgi:hypothetical protein
MIYFKDQYTKVWKIEPGEGNFTLVQMSTSRKVKDSNPVEYKNSSWSFVKFVASAHKYAGQLERGDSIVIKSGAISKEPYMKDGKKNYPDNPQIVVFAFDFPENSSKKLGKEKEEEQPFSDNEEVEENSDDLPF